MYDGNNLILIVVESLPLLHSSNNSIVLAVAKYYLTEKVSFLKPF